MGPLPDSCSSSDRRFEDVRELLRAFDRDVMTTADLMNSPVRLRSQGLGRALKPLPSGCQHENLFADARTTFSRSFHLISLTTSFTCAVRSISRSARCERSPSPLNVGTWTRCPRAIRRSATRVHAHPPAHAPWTRTNVAIQSLDYSRRSVRALPPKKCVRCRTSTRVNQAGIASGGHCRWRPIETKSGEAPRLRK